MPSIFISYRRDDTLAIAGRIFDRLVSVFGRNSIFMDVDAIPIGVDFREYIQDQVEKSDILIALIGHGWTGCAPGTERRIDQPNDFVRIEVETALQRNIPVIPVLIDGCEMPSTAVLPPSLVSLAYRNGLHVDIGRDFNIHVDRLIRGVSNLEEAYLNSQTYNIPALPEVRINKDVDSKKCRDCGLSSELHISEVQGRACTRHVSLCEKCAKKYLGVNS